MGGGWWRSDRRQPPVTDRIEGAGVVPQLDAGKEAFLGDEHGEVRFFIDFS